MTQAFNLSQLANGVNSSGQLNIASYVTGTLPTANLPTIPVANGGTGQTTYTNGQLLIGNTTGNTLTKATLTAGTNITITNGNGSITIASSGGAPTTAQVLSATSGANWQDVGSYGILIFRNGYIGNVTAGSNYSGQPLQYGYIQGSAANSGNLQMSYNGTVASGTWKAMCEVSNLNSYTCLCFMLRVA